MRCVSRRTSASAMKRKSSPMPGSVAGSVSSSGAWSGGTCRAAGASCIAADCRGAEGSRHPSTPYLVSVGNSHHKPRSAVLRPELVQRAQQGDRQAFDALATAIYDRLYAVGRRILRDGYAAQDAVQEALIRGWRDLRSLRDPSKFEAWMHRLLVHACHDQRRRSRRIEVAIQPIDLDRADPQDEAAELADRDELERAFLQLPIEHRAVLVLTHYLGLTAPE